MHVKTVQNWVNSSKICNPVSHTMAIIRIKDILLRRFRGAENDMLYTTTCMELSYNKVQICCRQHPEVPGRIALTYRKHEDYGLLQRCKRIQVHSSHMSCKYQLDKFSSTAMESLFFNHIQVAKGITLRTSNSVFQISSVLQNV